MLVELVTELFQPIIMAKIINEGVMEQDVNTVLFWGSIMLSFSFIALIAGIFNTIYASHASQSFALDLRKGLFAKVQSLSYSQFSLFSAGSLMTRLTNDIQQLQNTLFMSLRIMVRAPLLIIGGLVMAFFVHFQLALLLAVVVPFLFCILVILFTKGSKSFQKVQQKLDWVNTVMGENLAGMKLVRAYVKKDHETERFEQASKELSKKTASVLQFMEVTLPALLLIMNITIVGILWFGSQQMDLGTANVGEVVAVVNYATRITAALSIFSFIITAFSRAKASASRVEEILHIPIGMVDYKTTASVKNLQGSVTFENVSFSYNENETKILKNISFRLQAGQTMAILGATGSGKTSLLNLIPRLFDVEEGTVYIDDIDVRQYKQEELRQKIGIVPQNPLLFTGTIKENILWGNQQATDEEIIKACADAQIFDTIQKLPNQLQTLIGQKGVNLSGGQRQRLAIARALVRKPKILLFDDSTSALDLQTEHKLLEALKMYDTTTIMVTQKVSTATKADYILLLDSGEKIAEGKHTYLKENSPLYQAILQSQAKEGSQAYALEGTN